ncbi:MAG: hypothetical protein ACREAB_14275, partial [Blastocatellia bacterium]
MLTPRAVEVEANGNVIIADSGHGRVIRVSGGNASLVHQYKVLNKDSVNVNPFPSGIAIVGGNIYVANGNQKTVRRVTNGEARIAGTTTSVPDSPNPPTEVGIVCNYSGSNCGDDGAALNSGLNSLGSTDNLPLAGIEGDGNGIFVLDQGPPNKGRVRYINLSGGTVTVAGVNVGAGVISTVSGNGLLPDFYDGGLAESASFKTPVGVAVDGAGNLWVSDTAGARLRFINRGANPVAIFLGTPAEQTVPAGQIVTVNKDVGPGPADGVPVNQAAFDTPQGLFVTGQGIYVVDSRGGPAINERRTSRIRFINTTSADVTLYPGAGGAAITVPPGNIQTVAGGAPQEITGSFATQAKFYGASDIAVASNGTIYITEVINKVVRKVDGNTGLVSGVALPAGKQYTGLGFDSTGRLLVANFTDGTVHRESAAGSGTFAVFATGLGKPRDVAGAPDGGAFVTDGAVNPASGNHRIVRISSTGTTSVIAGGSAPGFEGDGGVATGGRINIAPSTLLIGVDPLDPDNVAPKTANIVVGQGGEIIFTDTNNNRIRRIGAAQVVCARNGTITISGNTPPPVLTSLNPTSVLAGSGGFTLTANGSGFSPTSIVRWNNQDRPTDFMSGTRLDATIPASDVLSAGTAQVTVFSPAPGGGTSAALSFTVTPPNGVPTITSISPTQAGEGGPAFNMTVNGTNFVNGSVVRLDGAARTTNFVSATQVTAQIMPSDLVGQGVASITVFNPAPGGGVSNG